MKRAISLNLYALGASAVENAYVAEQLYQELDDDDQITNEAWRCLPSNFITRVGRASDSGIGCTGFRDAQILKCHVLLSVGAARAMANGFSSVKPHEFHLCLGLPIVRCVTLVAPRGRSWFDKRWSMWLAHRGYSFLGASHFRPIHYSDPIPCMPMQQERVLLKLHFLCIL